MLVKLENGTLRAEIDTLGAQLVSLKNQEGTEYIWQRNPEIWKNCSPLLFPIVGNLRGGKTEIEGKICEIEKHGPCKHTEFSVKAQTADSAVFSLSDAGCEAGGYPYHCELCAEYRLLENRLLMKLTVRNTDNRAAFYCIGFHTGFRCPLHADEKFEDYRIVFSEEETNGYRRYDTKELQFDRSRVLPFPGTDGRSIPLNRELFSEDAIWFEHPCSREVALVGSRDKRAVRVSFPDFSSLALWTLPQEDAAFLCIEPWNGSAVCSDEDDRFLHKHDLQRLGPGEEKSYAMTVEV